MAIQISGTTVIDNNRKGTFPMANIGAYTQAQLQSNIVTGISDGSFTFCTNCSMTGKIVYWDSASSSWIV